MTLRRAVAGLVLLSSAACNERPGPGLGEDVGDDLDAGSLRWAEVFRDDFDGPAGAPPDPGAWNVEVRERGQNQELDFNTNERDNSFLDGQGQLVIQALEQRYQLESGRISSQPYTSARLNTRGLVEPRYARVTARIRLPAGKGLWPAFWLLGTRIDSVGWPECGEIDVMELAGSRPATIGGSLHGPGYSGDRPLSRSFSLESGVFADDFHVFSLEWTERSLRWSVDGVVYHQRTRAGIEALGLRWVFDDPAYIILNLAVGGLFDGAPDASTVFPSRMVVDFVSVEELQ